MGQNFLLNTDSYSAGQEIPNFHESRRFIIMLQQPVNKSYSESVEFTTHTSYPLSQRSNSIFSCHLPL